MRNMIQLDTEVKRARANANLKKDDVVFEFVENYTEYIRFETPYEPAA